MKKIITLISFCFCLFQAQASHLAGAELTYTHISGLDYKVRLKLYRDCSGAALPVTAPISVESSSLSIQFTGSANTVESGIVANVCPSVATTCTSITSLFPGYEYRIYEGTLTLPSASADWSFSYSSCCRNAAISNIQNPSSHSLTIYAKLDNVNALGGFNNAPIFLLNNSLLYKVGQTYTLDQTAIELDGDSLVYSLAPAKNGTLVQNCIYAMGYTYNNPFGAGSTISMNSQTGTLTFNNSMSGTYVVAIQVDEYRNGALIATTTKDLQFTFMNAIGANHVPTLSGINGGTSNVAIHHVCAGTSLTFTIDGSDLDLTDSVDISVDSTDIIGATMSTNNALQETLTFTWTPTASDIRPTPYFVILNATDNNCNYYTRAYLVFVHPCNQDSVWAGDANADYMVNNYDVLNVGIGNGTIGVVRPGATTSWVAEYCPDWTNIFLSGVNYKHADCNGDGTINATDLAAVTANYGLIHTKKLNIGTYKTRGLPDLYVDINGIMANAGSTIQVPIMLGDMGSPMNDIYGIAATINVSNTLSNAISINNTTSWLGNSTNSFLFQKSSNDNTLAFTMVRNNQTNTSGYGQIGMLSIPISGSALLNSDLSIVFSDLKLIKNDGTEITDFNTLHDTLAVAAPTNTSGANLSDVVSFYPIPVHDFIHLVSSQIQKDVHISLFSIDGKVVGEVNQLIWKEGEIIKMPTANLSNGVYFLKLTSDNLSVSKSVLKQ